MSNSEKTENKSATESNVVVFTPKQIEQAVKTFNASKPVDAKAIEKELDVVRRGNQTPTIEQVVANSYRSQRRAYNTPLNMAIHPDLKEQLKKLPGMKKWLRAWFLGGKFKHDKFEKDEPGTERGRYLKDRAKNESDQSEKWAAQNEITYSLKTYDLARSFVYKREEGERNGFLFSCRANKPTVQISHLSDPARWVDKKLEDVNKATFEKKTSVDTAFPETKREGKSGQGKQEKAGATTPKGIIGKSIQEVATSAMRIAKQSGDISQIPTAGQKATAASTLVSLMRLFNADDAKRPEIRATFSKVMLNMVQLGLLDVLQAAVEEEQKRKAQAQRKAS